MFPENNFDGRRKMKRGKKLYAGKANTLYEVLSDDGTVEQNILEMECTDRISAGDGERTDVVGGKGYANNLVSTLLFKKFEEAGVPTHFISEGTTPSSKFVKKADMIPLEVIGRNFTAGSFCRRYGVDEGIELDPMLFELTYKNDATHDPLITWDAAVAIGIVDDDTLDSIEDYTYTINDVARDFFDELGLTLIDFKVEFGFDRETGELMLADEFSQDTCRLHDADGNSVDKDIFRRGDSNGEVSSTYQKMVDMLEAMKK